MKKTPVKKFFSICVSQSFKATHHLRHYKGRSEPVHRHQWKVEIYVRCRTLKPDGMALDFIELDKDLNQLIQPFQNSDINKIPPFNKINPTAENMALWFFNHLIKKYNSAHQRIEKVIVWEASRYSAAVYHKRP